jgi:IclR family acetate operon transcriptional repressor
MSAKNRVELVEKTIRLLEVLAQAGSPQKLKQIAAGAGLVKSSAFRILFTLRELGYVEQSPDRCYQLSWRVLTLARGAGRVSLRTLARPYMERLRDQVGESVWLAERRGAGVYVVEAAEAAHPIRLSFRLGDACPLHASALGKAIAAYMTEEELAMALGPGELPRYTARTITDRTRLAEHLAEVRERGYSINDEETIEGAVLFGAPIFDADDRVFAAMSVSTLAVRCTPLRAKQLSAGVREAAGALSAALGSVGFRSTAEPSGG